MSRKKKPGIFALLKEKILGEPSTAAAKARPKKWDTVAALPYTGGESPEEALENELAHELGVAYDVYGRVSPTDQRGAHFILDFIQLQRQSFTNYIGSQCTFFRHYHVKTRH